MIADGPFAWLPAGALLAGGLHDLERGVRSVPALLVAMAWPRLAPLGLASKALADRVRIPGEDLELTAYRMLAAELGRDGHARFLALTAELESALNALEREARKRERAEKPRP